MTNPKNATAHSPARPETPGGAPRAQNAPKAAPGTAPRKDGKARKATAKTPTLREISYADLDRQGLHGNCALRLAIGLLRQENPAPITFEIPVASSSVPQWKAVRFRIEPVKAERPAPGPAHEAPTTPA